LRHCATNRKVAGLFPDTIIEIFYCYKPSGRNYGPATNSASDRNDYQKYFLEVKVAGAKG